MSNKVIFSHKFTKLVLLFFVTILGFSGCRNSDNSAISSDNFDTDFPVVIQDAFGDVIIPKRPDRVITLGWGSTEAALALGIIPIAMEYQISSSEGISPWVSDYLSQKGYDLPIALPNSAGELAYDMIASLEPDLILAPHSGFTVESYKLLQQIAPTVGYLHEPWSTPWRDVVKVSGLSLGRANAASLVVSDIEANMASKVADNSTIKNKTFAIIWNSANSFYVYNSRDQRVQFLADLGMKLAPSVTELSEGANNFFYTLSLEKISFLTSDVLISLADSEILQQEFLDSSYANLMSQVAENRVASISGIEFVNAISQPSALSIPWILDTYIETLVAAIK